MKIKKNNDEGTFASLEPGDVFRLLDGGQIGMKMEEAPGFRINAVILSDNLMAEIEGWVKVETYKDATLFLNGETL